MKIAIIVLSILFVVLAAIASVVLCKYFELHKNYIKTRDWGYAMRDKAAEYCDLYNNLRDVKSNAAQPEKCK